MTTAPQHDTAPTPWTFDGEMVRDANGRRVWDVEDANDNPEVAALVVALVNKYGLRG